MKYIWFSIFIMAIHTYPAGFDDKQAVSGELRLALEEQSPEAILEKCANVSQEPVLTPMGVVNPFAECVKGNSEMHQYVSLEDQQKPTQPENPMQKEIEQELAGTFDSINEDPTEPAEELPEDEMKRFLEMVENDSNPT